jgi:hypothetical protein
MNSKICNLCKQSVADKVNSHIIPKFMCKGLFEDTKPRHSIAINNKGKSRNIQDTPKENNILCSNCEKRIEIIETYFARKIIDIHNYKNLKNNFEVKKISNQEYLCCETINPKAFKLFIYTIIWRTSISSLNEFMKFKIEENIEEEIRIFLNSNLKNTHKELLENFDKIELTPKYDFCIFKPIVKSNQSRGIFTTYNTSENSHILLIVDFAIYFFTSEKNIDNTFKYFSNSQNEKVLIPLAEIEKWNELNKIIVHQMLENKNGC